MTEHAIHTVKQIRRQTDTNIDMTEHAIHTVKQIRRHTDTNIDMTEHAIHTVKQIRRHTDTNIDMTKHTIQTVKQIRRHTDTAPHRQGGAHRRCGRQTWRETAVTPGEGGTQCFLIAWRAGGGPGTVS